MSKIFFYHSGGIAVIETKVGETPKDALIRGLNTDQADNAPWLDVESIVANDISIEFIVRNDVRGDTKYNCKIAA